MVFGALVALAPALSAVREIWTSSRVAEILERIPDSVPIAAGATAWAWLLLIAARIAIPRLSGMERIRHTNIRPLLAAWLWLASTRIALTAVVVTPLGWLVLTDAAQSFSGGVAEIEAIAGAIHLADQAEARLESVSVGG